MSVQLSKKNLAAIQETEFLKKPAYNPDDVSASIVHFGPSNFARAHLAIYCDDLIAKGHNDCGIIFVSPQIQSNGSTLNRRDILKSQDCLFTVVETSGSKSSARIVGSVKDILVGPEDPNAVIDLMASPQIKLVTMTITQNGYYLSSKRELDLNHPDVRESLEQDNQPKITVAYIVKALEKRMQAGLPSFAVLSCDNMQGNGDSLKHTVLAYAAIKSNDLMHWISDNTSFYNTMVDRIVPAFDEQNVATVADKYGYIDQWPIFTEKFKQFVIESGPQKARIPAFDEVGAEFVLNVGRHEEAKIRMLNGVHMAIGVIGRLKGYTTTDEAMADPQIHNFAHGYMKEVIDTLKARDANLERQNETKLKDFKYEAYADQLFDRIEGMNDELVRLARNGTEKKNTRLLPTITDALNNNSDRDHLMTALAAWIRYVGVANPDKHAMEDSDAGLFISDPLAYHSDEETPSIVEIAGRLNGSVMPIYSIPGIFNNLDRTSSAFKDELQLAYSDLVSEGPRLEHHMGLDYK